MAADARFHAGCGSTGDHDAPHVAVHHDARAVEGGVRQIGDERGLLRTGAAPVTAVTARIVLRAAAHVSGQETVVPAEPLEAPDQHAVAPAGRGVVGVDADAPCHGVASARNDGCNGAVSNLKP